MICLSTVIQLLCCICRFFFWRPTIRVLARQIRNKSDNSRNLYPRSYITRATLITLFFWRKGMRLDEMEFFPKSWSLVQEKDVGWWSLGASDMLVTLFSHSWPYRNRQTGWQTPHWGRIEYDNITYQICLFSGSSSVSCFQSSRHRWEVSVVVLMRDKSRTCCLPPVSSEPNPKLLWEMKSICWCLRMEILIVLRFNVRLTSETKMTRRTTTCKMCQLRFAFQTEYTICDGLVLLVREYLFVLW